MNTLNGIRNLSVAALATVALLASAAFAGQASDDVGVADLGQITLLARRDAPVADLGSLVVSASSSDTSLIPLEGITFGGGSCSRTMTITPSEASTGTASVSVTVADAAGLSTTRTFRVTVNAVNVAFTTWTLEMYADPETAVSRSLLGFTLQNDAEDQPDAFDSLL